MLLGFYILFMERSLLIGPEQQGLWIPVTSGLVALLTLISTIPSARLSDRVGRKPVIYAACVIGAIGMGVTAIAPSIEVFVVGVVAIASRRARSRGGLGTRPTSSKASSGRYMGISNIAVVAGGPFASVIGGSLLFFFGGAVRSDDGPRAAFAAAIA
jgi:MFS family permease